MDATRKSIIVVVDDEAPVLDAFEMYLGDLVNLHTESDGRAAVALIAAGICPDVIVCDYRMPHMKGVEVVQRIRELLGHDVPAIIMSGDTSAEVIEAARLLRCAMLRKPFSAHELTSLIARKCSQPFKLD